MKGKKPILHEANESVPACPVCGDALRQAFVSTSKGYETWLCSYSEEGSMTFKNGNIGYALKPGRQKEDEHWWVSIWNRKIGT